MKQSLIAALTLAAARAQSSSPADGQLQGGLGQGYEYEFNYDLFVTKEDNLMNPLWTWTHKDGPNVQVVMYDEMIIPNNQVAYLKKMPIDGHDYAYQPVMKGGALQYKVDLSNTDCGCVAGAYAVSLDSGCNPEADMMSSKPMCTSIDIMQANKYGFEMAAHNCEDGSCDAKSKCMYSMNTDGIEKYGKGAYGMEGSLIDTNKPFDVETQFIASKETQKFWKIRTALSQGEGTDYNKIEMEADCSDYLSTMSDRLNGDDMAFVFSTWESTDRQPIDFECEHCDDVPVKCDAANTVISHVNFLQSGFFEDKAIYDIKEFQASSEYYGTNSTYYAMGLAGQELEAYGSTMYIGENNRVFVLDEDKTDSTYWAYYNQYIGGSVQFDVDVSGVYCDSVAGVYLAALDDEKCSWDIKKRGVTPDSCPSLNLMETNRDAFVTSVCDHCSSRIAGEMNGEMIYGATEDPNMKINSKQPYNVKIQFCTDKFQGDLKQIMTTLTQGDDTVVLTLDCEEKLEAYKDLLSGQMALAISNYTPGNENDVSGTCDPVNHPAPKSTISNIVWTENDSIDETLA